MTVPSPADKLVAAITLLDTIAQHADLGAASGTTPFIEAMRKAYAKAKVEAQKAAEEYTP